MSRECVRLVTYAWGHQHVADLLDYSLSAALAPGNLPALASEFDCTVVILTEGKLFDYVQSHPTLHRLKSICAVKLMAIDDLVSEPWQYGMTLAYALFRGFADLGHAMRSTYMLFLNADFILADGSYGRLIGRIRSGEPVHLSPSYCVVEELVKPKLRANRNSNDGILIVPPREMADMILENCHNTVLSKTINQPLLEFEYTDQFYWRVDSSTLIGHQMPIALVGMRPERFLEDISTFWDWGIVYDFCPSKRLEVIADSDDFLMMELRPRERSMDMIRVGHSFPKQIAQRMTGYITQYQIDNAQFQLTLHSRDLPPGINVARQELTSHVSNVLRHLPSPPKHASHPQWRYHLQHFVERLERKTVRAHTSKIKFEIERLEIECNRASLLSITKPNTTTSPQKTCGSATRNDFWHKDAGKDINILKRELARIEGKQPWFWGLHLSIFRRALLSARPYRLSRHWLKQMVSAPFPTRPPRILIGCASNSLLLNMASTIPSNHIHLSTRYLSGGVLGLLPTGTSAMDVCLLDISDSIPPGDVFNNIIHSLNKNGKIFIYWNDTGAIRRNIAQAEMARIVLHGGYHAVGYYAGSWASTKVSQIFMKSSNLSLSRSRPVKFLLLGAALAVAAPLLVLAELMELLRRRPLLSSPKYCSFAIIEIMLSNRPT